MKGRLVAQFQALPFICEKRALSNWNHAFGTQARSGNADRGAWIKNPILDKSDAKKCKDYTSPPTWQAASTTCR